MSALKLPPRFVVYDLEWTAWPGSQERNWSGPDEYREIYDIGAVLVEDESFAVKDRFRQLVTLELVPDLPAYSTNLTGITQEDIDKNAITFDNALRKFHNFSRDLPMYHWGSDSEVIAENCRLKSISNPFRPDQFTNMREVFKKYGIPADDYMSSTVVEYFGEKNKHTAHQGLDDALNIVEALRLLNKTLQQPKI